MSDHHFQNQLTFASSCLFKWKGHRAKLWSYTVSHQMLIIRLDSESRSGNVHLHCGDVSYLSAPTSWNGCELEIVHNEEGGFIVKDETCGVRIHCSVLQAFENCKPLE